MIALYTLLDYVSIAVFVIALCFLYLVTKNIVRHHNAVARLSTARAVSANSTSSEFFDFALAFRNGALGFGVSGIWCALSLSPAQARGHMFCITLPFFMWLVAVQHLKHLAAMAPDHRPMWQVFYNHARAHCTYAVALTGIALLLRTVWLMATHKVPVMEALAWICGTTVVHGVMFSSRSAI